MKKSLSIMFALLLLFLLPACGGEEEEDDWGNDGDGGNNEGNGGWESQEDKPGKVLKTRGFLGITALALGQDDRLYVGGVTRGDLYSDDSGTADALLVAFDAKGSELWGKQWDVYESYDDVKHIITDKDGYIYISGGTHVTFVMKFAPDGTKIWEQFPEFDLISSLVLDSQQNVYICRNNEIVKYSSDGKKLQSYKFLDESTSDPAKSTNINVLAVDSEGNLYAGAYTYLDLFADNTGKTDAVLVKFAPDGTRLWGKQWGTEGEDYVRSILFDNYNNILVVLGLNTTSNNAENRTTLNLKLSPNGDKILETDHSCKIAAICNDGNIYCVIGKKITKYNSNWEYLSSLPEYEYKYVDNVTCDSGNNVYAKNNQSIIKFSPSDFK